MTTGHSVTDTIQTSTRSRLQVYGGACVASGLLGVAAGLATLLYDPAVPSEQWSYPFTTSMQWMVSIGLAVAHALTALGFLGILKARPYADSRAATTTLQLAVAGFVLLTLAELLSGAIGGENVDSTAAGWVGTLFGVASLLTAIGGLVAGTVIVRARQWTGLGAWMLLASGVVMVLLVTPANVTGAVTFRTVALVIWSLTFLPLGRAIARSR
jgi:hypothetical protein